MKKYCIFILLNLVSLYSFSQHCRWDGSSFIMVDIKSNPSVKVQKIYLIDSAGKKVISKHYFGNKSEKITAEFWKNPPADAVQNPSKYNKQYFPFAKNYYVLEFGQYKQEMDYRILILYSSGNKMLRKEIPLSKQAVHMLCTLNKNLWGSKEKPIAVIL
ncbi:MAG TPA: hypothetical protein VKC90_01690 [Chitinophagaceae bacterium]|nr:hypothetical protein [Chitinophagaceae bacterium]